MRDDLSNIVVIDTETTGPNPFEHELLSIALVPMDREKPVCEIHVALPPNAKWSDFARTNFGRSEKMWRNSAISPGAAAVAVQRFIDGLGCRSPVILAGHNIGFDRAFLQKLAHISGKGEFSGISHRNFDTHTLLLSEVLKGGISEQATTSSEAFRYFDISIPEEARHTALGDALATRELISRMLKL